MTADPLAPPHRRSNRDAGIGDDRIGSPEPRDHRVARAIGEVDEQPSVARAGEAEQPALAAREDDSPQIDQIGGEDGPVAHDANAPGLFDDELHAAIERILDEREGRGEARGVHAGAYGTLRDCRDRPRQETDDRDDSRTP